MATKPFLKWAGGKRWLTGRAEFEIPTFSGRYIEPFLGGGAVFFAHRPRLAILSDLNVRLIETYQALKADWSTVYSYLCGHQVMHSKDHYYREREVRYDDACRRAAQFLYLNRACWNGLYRENLKGKFNVPIGTKDTIIFENDNFDQISLRLQNAELLASDFEPVIERATRGDFLFVDPPYTVAHNMNGFVKYNEKIFSWEDQERLARSLVAAAGRGASVVMTNADHKTVAELYEGHFVVKVIDRYSVISGKSSARQITSELLIHTDDAKVGSHA